MKLYCIGQSGNAYKVANFMNLAGIEFETVYVDFFNGEARSERFKEINEMGEVPVLVDNDLTISQSGVMLEYLMEKYQVFIPENRYENLRWVLWDNHKGSSQFGMTRFYNNFLSEKHRNDGVIAFMESRVKAALGVLENALTRRDFLVGKSLSPADFSCSSYLWYPEDFGFVRQDYPAIDAWLSRIESLPKWKHPYDLMPTDQAMLNRTPSAAKWHKEV